MAKKTEISATACKPCGSGKDFFHVTYTQPQCHTLLVTNGAVCTSPSLHSPHWMDISYLTELTVTGFHSMPQNTKKYAKFCHVLLHTLLHKQVPADQYQNLVLIRVTESGVSQPAIKYSNWIKWYENNTWNNLIQYCNRRLDKMPKPKPLN